MADLLLKKGREKPVLDRHPWIFSGAVSEVRGQPASGETVALKDHEGNFLAWAGYSPESQIRARIWSWDPDNTVGVDFFRRRIERAIRGRDRYDLELTNAFRLVHAESDGLPGLIVDRYNTTLVVQFLFSGAERWREEILDALEEESGIGQIFERSDSAVRLLEGLDERTGSLRGMDVAPDLTIRENGLRFRVDIQRGQKTGFYLDQRDTREKVRGLSGDRTVLDCYCYSGGMSINALTFGAVEITAVDASEGALRLGRENAVLNGLDPDRIRWVHGDVPTVLRGFRDRGQKFDLIILDPPNFAPTSSQAQRAARGYKDINLLAFKLLNPGGRLVTCSCSGGISPEFFLKVVQSAALDAGVDAQILGWLHQGEDHPVRLYFPEGAYLKGFICKVV